MRKAQKQVLLGLKVLGYVKDTLWLIGLDGVT